MFSTLWQDAICHSNEPLCGKKRSQGTFLKMSGSRECKVCNTVNSSGPALQGRGLPVYPFLRGTIRAKLRQEIEYLGTSVEESALFIWENRTETTVRTACRKMNSLDLPGGPCQPTDGQVHIVFLHILCYLEQYHSPVAPLFKKQKKPNVHRPTLL